MPETEHGIYYPEPEANTRLWEHFQKLAESVEALTGNFLTSDKMQTGRTTVDAYSGSGWKVVGTITFPVPFQTTPQVFIQDVGGFSTSTVYMYGYNGTTTGCSIRMKASGNVGSHNVNWVAVSS